MIDILHDATRWLIHWTALSMARDLLPRIMLEIPVQRQAQAAGGHENLLRLERARIKEPVPTQNSRGSESQV